MAADPKFEMKEKSLDVNEVEDGSGLGEQTLVPEDDTSQFHGLERYINLSSVVTFGFIILSSWESFASSFQFALVNGGPASMFYGGLLACIGECAVGFSLAELASIDPTVGAQYRWSANFAPSHPRFWGLLQGWITTSAWCFACAGAPSLVSNMVSAMASFNNSDYVAERWHISLIMIATMIVPIVFNLWFRKVLNVFEITGGVLRICLFVIVIVVLIVFGTRSDTDFVFKTLIWEESGWNNKGVAFGLGILPASFCLTGCDSVLHMSDEVKKVHTRVPRSIIVACVFNSFLLMTFIIVLLFYMGPITDELKNSPLPIMNILYNTTKSRAATNTLISLLVVIFFFALFNIFASVSRLVWVFARDRGMPFSDTFSYVHPTLKLPINALILVGCIVSALSLIYIGSDTAFNALISLQTFALHISYFFPILFFLIRKLRGPAPPYGPFKLGRIGVPINIFSCCYLLYVTTWMPFPQMLPVTGNNMNYCGPIFGAVVIGALVDWCVSGRKRFNMPSIKYE